METQYCCHLKDWELGGTALFKIPGVWIPGGKSRQFHQELSTRHKKQPNTCRLWLSCSRDQVEGCGWEQMIAEEIQKAPAEGCRRDMQEQVSPGKGTGHGL